MKGKTHTKVSSQRSIDHLDPSSDQHKEDQIEHRQIRQFEKVPLNWMEDACNSYLTGEKFISLGDGVILNPQGDEISSEEFSETINQTAEQRNFYWLHYVEKKSGKKKRRRIKKVGDEPIRPIRQQAVTFRPDHSLALHLLDKERSSARDTLKDWVKQMALECAKYFQNETGYEPLAITIHPNEGCLHFHIVYATISKDNALLHNHRYDESGKLKRGNPDLRRAGPCQVGLERARMNGIEIPDKERHLGLLEDKMRGGELPIDIRLAEVLDGVVELLRSMDTSLQPIFDQTFELWKENKSGKWKGTQKRPRQSIEENIDKEALKVGNHVIEH